MSHRNDCVAFDTSLFTLKGVRQFEGRSESTAPQATGSTAPSEATSPNTSTSNMSGGGASFAPTLPMRESGESSSTTYATLTEGKITMDVQ
ncbi:hypothetical protein [Hydromonas duriensis]|uniref:hypothetical protein n=1 Tax=Hydromonas duriensis TaxID=1527608 RepID=UPI00105C92EA|nr:hypothetical protein [Hydromonas duriensis]